MMDTSTESERALSAHFKEYEVIHAEVNQRIGLRQELINYSIAITGATAALFGIGQPSVIEQQPVILLAVALLLISISWAATEASLHIGDLSKYIRDILTPKIQSLIGDNTSSEFIVLKWEKEKIDRSARMYYKGIMSTGKHAIAFIPSVIFILLFYAARPPYIVAWSFLETLLFITDVVAILILLVGGYINISFILKK
jgi:hypothetical protein